MKRNRHREGKNSFDLIEEATHLLRAAPVAMIAAYYAGTVPFVLGLLFFWTDMGRSPFAAGHLGGASFGMALLFFWMKFWHAMFARMMHAQVAGRSPAPLSWRTAVRLFFTQAIVQPAGLFLVPLSLLPVIPAAWAYAFFQNAVVLANDEDDTATLLKKSWQQAALWPRQNYVALLIMAAFAGFVFLNWAAVCFSLPQLLKMLFGIESVFTRSPFSLLNSTFFAVVGCLTFLCVDPLLKIIYVLRCFYGESLQSGEDLKSELKVHARAQKFSAATVLLLVLVSAAPAAAATATFTNAPQISSAQLDQAIAQTIHERKFTWRMPREKIAGNAETGVIGSFFNSVGKTLRAWARELWDWLRQLYHKLFPDRRPVSTGGNTGGYGWIMSVQILIYVLAAAAIAALVIFLWRVWRGRQKTLVVASEAMATVPDLADENVRADQLPEDGWTKLARELLERGEFRLALRAFYLASLAHLAARHLISLARFKSNRDYERELLRRAHAFPELLPAFGRNVSVFERIWYGLHEADREVVDVFAANVEKIKSAG